MKQIRRAVSFFFESTAQIVRWLLDTFINSFLLVAAGEMGDKTQLLSLLLVARYRKPYTILLGVFVATVLNHALASWLGNWVSGFLLPEYLRPTLAGVFFLFGLWILVPDSESAVAEKGKWGIFFSTLVVFFLAEMGDKTQLATIALGAHYPNYFLVTLGTTLGMMVSNALAIFLGQELLAKIPMKWIRGVASILFIGFGLLVLLG